MSQKVHRTYPLRTTLVIAVIATIIITISILFFGSGIPAYVKTKQTLRLLWTDVAKQTSETAKERLLRYFQNAPITLKIVEGLILEKQLSTKDFESIFDISYQILKENPEFMSVYSVKADKTFYGVFRKKDVFEASVRNPQGQIKNYRIGPDKKWVLFEEIKGDYDPEKRPFWKVASSGGWTDPYLFATTGAKGYSYVLPEKNGGFWAVDFQIDHLDTFLKQLDLGKESYASIIANDGTIIASSGKIRGERIFYETPFPKSSQIPWKVVTSIHESNYLDPIRETAFHAMLYGAIPVFIFLILIAAFFGRVSRRLKEIAWEMDEVGNLTFKDRLADHLLSRIREVNAMNHSLNKMKVGLQSFAKYIPVDLIKKLLFSGKPAETGAEKKEIAVLFADLAGFTSMAETLKPDEVGKIIEEFLSIASEKVHAEGGIIDKFIGDAVMALWGAPNPTENPSLSACKAALAIQKALKDNPKMNHRIGINSGFAMVGNFGSSQRLDYTAIGDTVNVAARLEKLNKKLGTQILIGPDTAKAVDPFMQLSPQESVIIEGRSTPILVYALLGEKNLS